MAAQRLAQNGLDVAFVIDVSGVEIIHAPIQGGRIMRAASASLTNQG